MEKNLLQSCVIAEEEGKKVSQCFSLLGDGTRLRIFSMLCHSKLCVLQIAQLINMTSPAVAHHLKKLKSGGLVQSARHGKEMHYCVATNLLADELHSVVDKLFCHTSTK